MIGKEFQRHGAAEFSVFGFVNHAHAADTDLIKNAIVCNQSAFQVRPRVGSGRYRANACSIGFAVERRSLNEISRILVMGQQRFHFAAEVLISGTRTPDELASAALFHLQGSVKDSFDLSPPLTLH